MVGDWRVSIAAHYLPELMSPQSLTGELSRRLGYQVKVFGGNGEVVWYAPSAGSADEIAQAAREVLAREVLARPDAGRHWSASVVRIERIGDHGWRVCLASGDLPELMSQQRLTREVSSRLGSQVKASEGSGEVVWYAPSAGSADEIAQAAREVLAREVLARPHAGRYRRAPVVRTERWIRGDWRDVTDKSAAVIAAELQAEHEARQERERQTSVTFGIPAWEVRVDVPSHRDVVALAGHLAAQGWRVRRRRRRLYVGADCEDDAKGLGRELSGDGRADAETAFRVRRVSYNYMLVDPFPVKPMLVRNFGSPGQQNSQVIAPHHRLRPNLVPSQVLDEVFRDAVDCSSGGQVCTNLTQPRAPSTAVHTAPESVGLAGTADRRPILPK